MKKDVLFIDTPVKSFEVDPEYGQLLSDNSVAVDYVFSKKTGVDRNPQRFFYTPGLLCLASYIKEKGFSCDYVNLSLENRDISEIVLNYTYVAISSLTVTIDDNLSLAREIKCINSNIKIILGGYHASNYPEKILSENSEIDFILLGEGEKALVNVLSGDYEGKSGIAYRDECGKVECNRNVDYLSDDEIPIPDYTLIAKDIRKYNIHVGTMRGCVGRCRFCVNHTYWGKPRMISLSKVEEEFKILSELLPEGGRLWITDNILSYDKKRFMMMTEMIEKYCKNFILCCDTKANFVDEEVIEGFKRINVVQVALGVEDCCEDILNKSAKGLRMIDNLKVMELIQKNMPKTIVYAYWLVGLPGTNKMTMFDNHKMILELLREGKVDVISPKMFIPYPGTEFYDNAEKYGIRIRKEIPWSDYERKNIPLPYMYEDVSEEELFGELICLMKDIIDVYREVWNIPDNLFKGAIPKDLPFTKKKK